MAKIKLQLDNLAVETFETGSTRGADKGTVVAHGSGSFTCGGNTCNAGNTCNCPVTGDETCGLYCGPQTADTCDICA